MQHLNEDCIFGVLDYLQIIDQFNLIDVWPDFKSIVKRNWRIKYNHTLRIDFVENDLTTQQFEKVLKEIHQRVQVIELDSINLKLFIILSGFQYPQAVELSFKQSNELEINDNHLMLLANKFTNLKAFCPHGQFTGENMHILCPNLEVLLLQHCHHIKSRALLNILKHLHLKSINISVHFWRVFDGLQIDSTYKIAGLQRLGISSINLITFFQGGILNKIHDLRELTLYDCPNSEFITEIFYNTRPKMYLKLVEEHIVLTHNMEAFATSTDFKKLKRFSLKNDINNRYHSYPKETIYLLQNMAKIRFNNLQDIILYNILFYEESHILLLLENGMRLTLISLENCKMKFSEFVLDMNSRFIKRRNLALTLNWYKNKFDPLLISQRFEINANFDYLNTNKCNLCIKGNSHLVHITAKKLYKPFEGNVKFVLDPTL